MQGPQVRKWGGQDPQGFLVRTLPFPEPPTSHSVPGLQGRVVRHWHWGWWSRSCSGHGEQGAECPLGLAPAMGLSTGLHLPSAHLAVNSPLDQPQMGDFPESLCAQVGWSGAGGGGSTQVGVSWEGLGCDMWEGPAGGRWLRPAGQCASCGLPGLVAPALSTSFKESHCHICLPCSFLNFMSYL